MLQLQLLPPSSSIPVIGFYSSGALKYNHKNTTTKLILFLLKLELFGPRLENGVCKEKKKILQNRRKVILYVE